MSSTPNVDKFIEEIKAQQKNFIEQSSSGQNDGHDAWVQFYAAMWIEILANAVKADLAAPTEGERSGDGKSIEG